MDRRLDGINATSQWFQIQLQSEGIGGFAPRGPCCLETALVCCLEPKICHFSSLNIVDCFFAQLRTTSKFQEVELMEWIPLMHGPFLDTRAFDPFCKTLDFEDPCFKAMDF